MLFVEFVLMFIVYVVRIHLIQKVILYSFYCISLI